MINQKYSYKDFLNVDLTEEPAEDFNNTEIIGSCFYKEGGMTDVFPPAMTGVTFKKCNLDNCIIPSGNTLTSCTNKEIIAQKDKEDWVCSNKIPVEPLQKERFLELGLSIDPKDIPSVEKTLPLTIEKHDEILAGGG